MHKPISTRRRTILLLFLLAGSVMAVVLQQWRGERNNASLLPIAPRSTIFTHAPKNGSLYATAFLTADDPRAALELSARARQLDAVFVGWQVLPRASCTLSAQTDSSVLEALKDQQVDVFLTASNGDASWHAESAAAILRQPALRTCIIHTLARQAKRTGVTGINVDIEALRPEDAPHFVTFLEELATALHAQKQKLIVDLPAEPNDAYDPAAIGSRVDGIVVMAYDQHETTSDPGPIASQDWVQDVTDRYAAAVPPQQLLLGIGTYGYDWGSDGNDASWDISAVQAERLAQDMGLLPLLDPASGNSTFTYQDGDGNLRSVWFFGSDASSGECRRLRQAGIAGFALWKLGMEEPRFWEAVAEAASA